MRLKKYDEIDENQYINYIEEWENAGARISPSQSARDNESYAKLQVRWREYESDTMKNRNMVPATLYFLCDKKGRIVGAADFRHRLNGYLEKFGGNIGYGIRPYERMKGYGTMMLSLLLKEIKDCCLDKVLITCFSDNVGSARIIEACNGELENVVNDNGRDKNRYWVRL